MRRALVVAATAAGLLALAPPATAAPRCDELEGRDLAPSKRVKLVERTSGGRVRELRGCVMPSGRAMTLVRSSGDSTWQYGVLQVAGRHVLVHERWREEAGTVAATMVFDLRRRSFYNVATLCHATACNDNIPTDQHGLGTLINSRGEALALIGRDGSDQVTLRWYWADGQPLRLDRAPRGEIPPSSLGLRGRTASWEHSGERVHVTPSG